MQLPISLADRVNQSELIIEGEIISSQSKWNVERNMIFTVSQIRVFKLFKGSLSGSVVTLLTEGGQDGLDLIEVGNEFMPVVGEQGVFMLKMNSKIPNLAIRFQSPLYTCFMAHQSTVMYNLFDKTANTPFQQFNSIPYGLYPAIHQITGQYHTELITNTRLNQALQQTQSGNQVNAVPTITSFTPTTITAGTRSLLTINGTNFGASRGAGFVEFRNANDGGASWVQAKASDYRTWTNTQITVWVPSSSLSNGPSAGTGQIRVTNNDPNIATSTGTLTVTYSVINVEFDGKGQYTEHQNDNTTGGYTFQCEAATFAANAPAVAAFTRAMNTWTCSTNMNWILGANTAVDTALADGINIVRFDKGPSLPAGVLGRATSRFSGCINAAAPSDTVWTVTEVDVVYDDGAAGLSWNFSTANATFSQIDFETVTVHELGHAHQLQHIINSGAIMHYSISNGQTSRVLSPTIDVPAGNFVMTRSTAAHGACKPSPMTSLSLAASVSIAASPGTSVCSNTSVTFTATPVLPAGTATYTWKKNGVTVGTNSTTYTNASWVNGDQVQVVMSVSGGCNQTVNSNTLTMTVSTAVTASVSIAASPGTTVCNGTNVTFTATPTNGGTTPAYQWKLNGSNVGTNSPTYSNAALANGNTVSCVMTSNANCVTGSPATSNTLTMTVNTTPSVSISPATVTICSGQSTTLTASGASTYAWSPGGATTAAITVTPGATTTYTVIGTTGSCTASATRLVTVNTTPSVSISPASATICSGQSTTLTASGATSYSWAPGGAITAAVTVNPGATTTYTVIGTTGSCTASATRLVTVNTTPTVSISPATATICSGQSTTLTASGATSYSWTPGGAITAAVTVSPGATTTYTVIGTTGSCTASATRLVTVNTTPTITISPASTTICNGSSTTLTASGGTTYSWTPGGATSAAITVSPTTTTAYTVVGTSGSCSANAIATVTVTQVPIAVSPTSTTICSGQNTTLTASGATTYSWSPGGATTAAVTVAPTSTTTYTVTGTVSGCTKTATSTVNVTTVSVSISPASTTICAGQSTTLTASGATTYAWTPGGATTAAITVSPTTTTAYTVVGTTAGCSVNAIATVTVTSLPTITISPASTTICNGSSTTLTASGGTSYSWTPGGATTAAITVSPTATTAYTVVGTSAGCSANAIATVTVTQVPIAVSPTSTTICSGQNTTLTASGATTYSWSPGGATTAAITVAPTSATTYTVTGTVSGCTKTATATVNVTTVNIVISPPTASICPGGNITLTASGGTTYVWAPGGATTAAVTVSPTSTTTYTVTSASGGCPGSATRVVTVNPSVTASINIAPTPGNSICSGTSVLFTATISNGGASPVYQWTRNGTTVGPNANAYPTSTLSNGDIISCTLTSNAACVTNPTVVSNPVTMTVSGGLPTISSFTPTSGTSGTTVTINGTNFVGVSAVKFNGTNASFTVVNATQITATVPAGATTGLISVTNNCGTGNSATNFTVGAATANLSLQVLLQGMYIGSGQMIAAINPSGNPNSCDTITVSLAAATSPYAILYSNKDTINLSGLGVFTFPGAVIGSSYYIVVRHRNSLETWSAAPVSFSSSNISYNFQNSAAQAYGSNQASLGGGKFGLHSGDTNQDDLIEASDYSAVENAVQSFLFGYVATDLNGDQLVEASDYSLVENNSLLFLFTAAP